MEKLQEVVNRPKRYENIDGTGEMFFGLMFLVFGLSDRLEVLLPASGPKWQGAPVVLGALALALGAGYWLRGLIRRRWTWSRTGYVARRREPGHQWAMVAASFIIASLLALAFARVGASGSPFAQMQLLGIGWTAVLAAPYLLWVFTTGREHPWRWLIFVLMVLGLLVIGLKAHGDYFRVLWLVMVFLGVAWLASGAGTLRSYIWHTQPPAAEAE